MIGKKITQALRISVLVFASCFLFSPAAHAEVDVVSASIVRIGIDPRFEGPMVQLTDDSATPLWTGVRQFYLSATLGNGGLATMLTAFSLGESVFVRIAGTGASGSLVTIIFVNAPAP